MLRRHDVPAANMCGHSFGTFVIAHLRKLYPELVASVLLLDPVCMLTLFPALLQNFIYKGLTLGEMMKNPADAARWLASRDLLIAETFCRCAVFSNFYVRIVVLFVLLLFILWLICFCVFMVSFVFGIRLVWDLAVHPRAVPHCELSKSSLCEGGTL